MELRVVDRDQPSEVEIREVGRSWRSIRDSIGELEIPRAHLLADIAAKHPRPGEIGQFRIDLATVFDSEVRDAASGVEDALFDDRPRGASLYTAPAASAPI